MTNWGLPQHIEAMIALLTAPADFVTRCDAYARRRRIKRSTLSVWLFNDGKRIAQIAGGQSDIGVARLARALEKLAELEAVDEAA